MREGPNNVEGWQPDSIKWEGLPRGCPLAGKRATRNRQATCEAGKGWRLCRWHSICTKVVFATAVEDKAFEDQGGPRREVEQCLALLREEQQGRIWGGGAEMEIQSKQQKGKPPVRARSKAGRRDRPQIPGEKKALVSSVQHI